MPISVGVDAVNLLHDRRGIGRYVRSVLQVWLREFASRVEPLLLVPHVFPRVVASRLANQLGVDRVRTARRQTSARFGLDVVWYPWNGMTWTTSIRSVVTLHDLWPFAAPAADTRRRAREQRHYVTAVEHADRFIADSQFTANEAVKYLGLAPHQIDVVPLGVGPLASADVTPARFDGVDRYVLFVGEVEPRKDIDTLIEAATQLPAALRRTTALVIAGRNAGRSVAGQDAGVRIETTGEVSDERLASLYAGAAAFAFPSRYEGFGLPVLEAMSYGTPVVASSAASIPEAGGDAAIYFAPGDAQGLSLALARVLEDSALARRLAAAGRARAAEMTHALCARKTLEVFERVAGR